MSLFPPLELVTNRHGNNNHDNHRDIVHVILTEDLVDDDDDDDDDGDGDGDGEDDDDEEDDDDDDDDDDTEAMKEI